MFQKHIYFPPLSFNPSVVPMPPPLGIFSLSVLLSSLTYLDSTWILSAMAWKEPIVARAWRHCSIATLVLGSVSIHVCCEPE